MERHLSPGVGHDSHLDVDIRATAAVLAAQIEALVAKRKRGECSHAERLVARPSETLRHCVSCLADRIKDGTMAPEEVPSCVTSPTLFKVLDELGNRAPGANPMGVVAALERLSAVIHDLPSLGEEHLIRLRDFLVEASNDRSHFHHVHRWIPPRSWAPDGVALRDG